MLVFVLRTFVNYEGPVEFFSSFFGAVSCFEL